MMMQQVSMQHRRGRSLSSAAKEKDEDLALFHEMQQREQEKKRSSISSPSGFRTVNPPLVTRIPAVSRMKGVDDLFSVDSEKNDYDWLLTPPGTPLFSSMDNDAPGLGSPHKGASLVRSLTALKMSRLASAMEPSSKLASGSLGRQPSSGASFPSNSLSSRQNSTSRFPSSSNIASRQSNSSISNFSNVGPRQSASSSCSSSSSGTVNRRSSSLAPTTATRASSRPSTPTGRASIPSTTTRSASLSRPSTPTRRPATPTLRPSYPPAPAVTRSSSVSKASSLPSRNIPPSRGSSPTIRPRPWQPSAMPGFSLEPPPNLRTTVPERSPSNQRGSSVSSRPGSTTATRTSQSDVADASNRSRRQSSSPSITRGRTLSGSQSRDPVNTRIIRTANTATDVTVPVVMGSKMLEKVMRARCTPSSPEEKTNYASGSQPKNSVKQTTTTPKDTSGFGRNLSKKSLDMALRHMDIRRSPPNGFRPLISNVPASSLYSVRAGNGRIRPPGSVTDSPVATSSNASSEYNMNILQEREGSDLGDEASSERGTKISPLTQQDFALKDARISNWVNSPDYRDDNVDLLQLFKQGVERSSGSESPLICENSGASECSDIS